MQIKIDLKKVNKNLKLSSRIEMENIVFSTVLSLFREKTVGSYAKRQFNTLHNYFSSFFFFHDFAAANSLFLRKRMCLLCKINSCPFRLHSTHRSVLFVFALVRHSCKLFPIQLLHMLSFLFVQHKWSRLLENAIIKKYISPVLFISIEKKTATNFFLSVEWPPEIHCDNQNEYFDVSCNSSDNNNKRVDCSSSCVRLR